MLRASPRFSGIFLGAAVALAVGAAGAAASQEQRTYTGGRFYMDISGNRGVIGRAEGEAHSQQVEIESWSWGERGAAAPSVTIGRGAPIPVIPFNHEVKSPRDVASGQASGKRQHHPIRMREGSVTVVIPAGTCIPGTRYPMVTLQSDTHVYELQDVTVASCTPVAVAKGAKDKAKLDYMIVKMEEILVSG